jgi:Fe-S oxidoreductase
MSQQKNNRSWYSKYYREIDVLHGLQTRPEERDWLLSVPKGDVKPTQVVLYLGCNILRTSHLVRTVMDVFKLLDVDFVAVGGAAYCCGIQHYNRGDEKAAQSVAATTVQNFEKFSPERVVMWCPSCISYYDDIMDMRNEFSFQHATEFLVENLDKLQFQPQPEAKVSLHYHTGRPQSDEEARCAFKLLSALPGLDVVDLGTDTRLARHCTDAVREKLGPEVWDGMVEDSFQKAVDAGVDIYSTLYHGCQRKLCGYEKQYPLQVEHYLTLVGRALGIEHEDQYKKHMLLGDANAIMADTSPCAVASGVSLAEARSVIEQTFVS